MDRAFILAQFTEYFNNQNKDSEQHNSDNTDKDG